MNTTNPNATDLVEHTSTVGFAAALDRLTRAIEAAGLQVFATIDHAAAAHAIGMAMPPTLVLFYGNPKGGTPLMLATPSAALDLPLRLLLREESAERTVLAFHPIGPMLGRLGVPEALASRLAPAQQLLVDALASSS
jgi:uncharacterized protein (DUF302 family)